MNLLFFFVLLACCKKVAQLQRSKKNLCNVKEQFPIHAPPVQLCLCHCKVAATKGAARTGAGESGASGASRVMPQEET